MLAIIPARGGSVAVPKKNLRAVDGTPLVLRTARVAREANRFTRIVVTTDDSTIRAVCEMHGFEVLDRPAELATDEATVQEVAVQVTRQLGWDGPVAVMQPTSPLLRAETVRTAVDEFTYHADWDSLVTVVPDHGLLHDTRGAPLFAGYANRQYTEPTAWRRTGGLQLARTVPAKGGPLTGAPLVGDVHHLYEVPPDEGLDIDTRSELYTARLLARSGKRLEFRVRANRSVGSGHLRRCLQLAQELDHYLVTFRVTSDTEDWAVREIETGGYRVETIDPRWLSAAILDVLDTTREEVGALQAAGVRVITLEDLGPGSAIADVVINELYDRGTLYGTPYAVLRPEFLDLPPYEVRETAEEVLVTFGGTDPSGLVDRFKCVSSVATVRGVEERPMVAAMRSADVVLTSCGRTVHEAAAAGVPTVAVAANTRESWHSVCPGVLYLGLHAALSDEQVTGAVARVMDSVALRREMSATARAAVDGRGARRIAHLVEGLMEGL